MWPKKSILTIVALGVLALAITVSDVTLIHRAKAAPAPADSGSAVHGVNFLIKNIVDETFCVETDVAVSATPHVYMASCTGRANQRWTFTDGADGSNVVVGDLGSCSMVEHGPPLEMLGITTCDYGVHQRFTVTPAGLIMEEHSGECLTVKSPIVSGDAIALDNCQSPIVPEQIWRLVQ